MATSRDIKIEDSDLYFYNGDFSIWESDQQHVEDIISENLGAYKKFPNVGVGIYSYLNGSGVSGILSNEIRKQLSQDGFGVVNIDIDSNFNVNIDAIRG